MSIVPLRQEGHTYLHRRNTEVSLMNLSLSHERVRDLIDTMRATNLVGIAAPQIGLDARIFVTEIRHTPTRNPEEVDILRVYINPEIISLSHDTVEMWEGCGSVEHAGVFTQVSRPKEITLSAYDVEGKYFTLSATGLLARVIQHEMDHLNGILFTERVEKNTPLISREEYLRRIAIN